MEGNPAQGLIREIALEKLGKQLPLQMVEALLLKDSKRLRERKVELEAKAQRDQLTVEEYRELDGIDKLQKDEYPILGGKNPN